jgi:RHS repeat-associated protein
MAMRAWVKVCAALGLAALVFSGCGASHSTKKSSGETTTIEEIAHEAADECDDDKDNDGDGFVDCDDLDCRTDAKEHCRFSLPLDRTVPTNLRDATSFLYTAPDPVQKDLEQDQLDTKRVSAIHGRVISSKGKGLRDVRVSLQGHPELGYSMSRSDGRYDLVVNGGATYVLRYERQGYLEAARSVATEWQREHVAPDVGLVRMSTEVHTVRVAKGQVVRAEKVEDDWGSRQPLLVFDKGTEAELLLPDGSHKKLSELHLRVTEYPFDTETPPMPGATARFAPGPIPVGSLNYSLNFTVDEAEEFDAVRVEFSKPVAYYVENFLGLPVGSSVPLRSYNPETSEWETLEPGRVVEVVGVSDGKAELDIDGDGKGDSAKALGKLGVSGAELSELGSRYKKGVTLWRHQVEHFTDFTDLWNLLVPGIAVPPLIANAVKPQADQASWRGKVLVEPQVVRESVEVVGTPFSLVYQGDRNPGYLAAYHMVVPLLGEVVPPLLQSVCVVVEIAGQMFPEDPAARCQAPKAGDEYDFTWNGQDVFEQVLQGAQIARVWVGYAFDALLPEGVTVAVPQGAESLGLPGAVIWNRQDVPLGLLDAQGYQFGGFGLDVQHAYDPVGQMIYFGDGSQRHADGLHLQVVAMDQRTPGSSDSSESSQHLEAPDSIATAEDGSAYVSDDGEESGRVWRIGPDGSYETVLGDGAPGAAGEVELEAPQGVAIDPADGTLYVVDWRALLVWRLSADGSVDVLLGDDPAAAVQHPLEDPDGLGVGPNHELYVADANKVWKVWPNQGRVEEVPYVGGDAREGVDTSEVTEASQVPLEQASGLAIDRTTGTLFVSSRKTHQVWRIESSGNASLVAGTGKPGFSGDGGLAVDAELNEPRGIALGRDGSLFIVDQENGRVRRVFPNGQITTVAGGGADFPASSLAGTEAQLSRPDGLAIGPNGVAYVGGAVNEDEPPHLFRASSPTGAEFGADEYLVPSDDGQVAFRFNSVGRHLETVDVMTGKPLLKFKYDGKNRLELVTDLDGLETQIARDDQGLATKITGPHGQVNELGYDADAKLTSVSADAGKGAKRTRTFGYDALSGLLNAADSGEGNEFDYEFDPLGRVMNVTGPMGFAETYTGTSAAGAQSASVTIPKADGADSYQRESTGAKLYEGFSFEDRDGQTFSETETPDRKFETRLPGGAVVQGTMAASDQWGEQVRYPSESTLTTPGGKKLTKTQSITTTGLARAADGTVIDPLDYDTQQATTTINGVSYQRTYDRATRTLTTLSPEGRSTVTTFDDEGRPVRVQVPGLADTTYEYDGEGQLKQLTREADGESRVTKWEYRDTDGLLDYVTDALGRTVKYDYDGVGRVTTVTRPDGASTQFAYDTADNLTEVTPPGLTGDDKHVYTYEQGAGLVDYKPPGADGDTVDGFTPAELHYEYDQFVRPSATTLADGSVIESHYYQDFYRPSQLWVTPAGDDTEEYFFTYDKDRNVIKKLYGPVNGIEFTYDSPLLTKVEPKGPSASGIVNFAYDDFLRVSRIRLTGSDPVDYLYDNDSLLVQAGPLTILRDPESGRVTGTTVGAIVTEETPNGFGELEELMAQAGGDELFSQQMQRDALGRITTLTETNQGEATTTEYTYDEVGRLDSVTTDGDTVSYYYDKNGNRYPESGPDGAEYDAQDRILSYGEVTFEATATGDVVRKNGVVLSEYANGREGYELVYSPLGELERVNVQGTGDTVTYETDPFGRRVGRKLNGGKPKGWIYSSGLRIIAEIDNNAARTDFIYGTHPTVPELMIKAGKTYRLITDYLGSVRLVVNVDSGEVAQALDYDAWGLVTRDTNPGFQPFGFAGGLYDPATGLVRFGARDYDPETGRWVTRDPTGLAGGVNVYLYADGDPVNLVDPTGSQPVPPQVIKVQGSLGTPTVVFTKDLCPTWGKKATTKANAIVIVKALTNYDRHTDTTRVTYRYSVHLNGISITYYEGSQPDWKHTQPGVTLGQHEMEHVAFDNRFYTSSVMTALFNRPGVVFQETLKGDQRWQKDALAGQMTERARVYLQAVSERANLFHVDHVRASKLGPFPVF